MKTPKPLVIIALPPCNQWPELDKLEEKGHTVIRVSPADKGFHVEEAETHEDVIALLLDADIIIGSNCWRMSDEHKQYLPLALSGARVLRYKSDSDKASIKKQAQVAVDVGLAPAVDGPTEEPS